jgi:GNAT superfamily N-acetyltransferase
MRTYNRPFNLGGDDFEKLWRFLQQDYAHKGDAFTWLVSRLGDWKYGLWNEKKFLPTFFQENAQLWVDAFDQPVGFVLDEDGGEIIFILTAPGWEYLYPQMLAWAVQHWAPRFGSLKVEVSEYHTALIQALEYAGFQPLGGVAVTCAYDLRNRPPEQVRLPGGYRVVDMQENGDYSAKALVNAGGFHEEDQVSEFAVQRYAYSRLNPAYDPSLDFSALTEEGVHASSCVGFSDPLNRVAEVEKVCTHYAHRRKRLAEAVIRACFQRLAARGVERAYITGYGSEAIRLYGKLEPGAQWKWMHYELRR